MKKIHVVDNTYALRYAAGCYWLIDMSQKGVPYKRPMTLNEVGAKIWEMLVAEYGIDEMCKKLSEEYDISKSELEEDINQFLNQLHAYGVKIEEKV